MKTPPLYKSFAVTQLIKGVDTTTDIDSPASVVDTAPAGIRYGNAESVALADDLAQLRSDVEASLQAITTAFNDLKTQIESA
jgi:hypothetical protein